MCQSASVWWRYQGGAEEPECQHGLDITATPVVREVDRWGKGEAAGTRQAQTGGWCRHCFWFGLSLSVRLPRSLYLCRPVISISSGDVLPFPPLRLLKVSPTCACVIFVCVRLPWWHILLSTSASLSHVNAAVIPFSLIQNTNGCRPGGSQRLIKYYLL